MFPQPCANGENVPVAPPVVRHANLSGPLIVTHGPLAPHASYQEPNVAWRRVLKSRSAKWEKFFTMYGVPRTPMPSIAWPVACSLQPGPRVMLRSESFTVTLQLGTSTASKQPLPLHGSNLPGTFLN